MKDHDSRGPVVRRVHQLLRRRSGPWIDWSDLDEGTGTGPAAGTTSLGFVGFDPARAPAVEPVLAGHGAAPPAASGF